MYRSSTYVAMVGRKDRRPATEHGEKCKELLKLEGDSMEGAVAMMYWSWVLQLLPSPSCFRFKLPHTNHFMTNAARGLTVITWSSPLAEAARNATKEI